MNPSHPKIFGIGLSKTGTTSLARALEILGYKTRDYMGITRYVPGDLSSIDLDVIDANDAFTDTPIPSFYRELDARYPGSKFILTVRDAEGWLQSCKKQFNQKLADKQSEASNRLFMDLYGCTVFDEERFQGGYAKFTSGAYQYFRDRPQDLLVMDIAAGEGWEKLCVFLGVPIPDTPFPRANVTRIRWLDINKIIEIARQAGDEIMRAHDIVTANPANKETSNAGGKGIATKVLNRARYALMGGADRIQDAAINRAGRIIRRRLEKLYPDIPCISRQDNTAPYSERRDWNHFWLIDPLDSNAGLLAPGRDFTLNISLIEDRSPVLGIVYVPAKNTLYYSMMGKGAFRLSDGREPDIVKASPPRGVNSASHAEDAEKSHNSTLHCGQQPASKALSMCMVASGEIENNMRLTDTMEWETAGAHAVVKSAGMTVINCDTGSELTYNKENLRTSAIAIK